MKKERTMLISKD